jgi:anti-sigma B factor antagonist
MMPDARFTAVLQSTPREAHLRCTGELNISTLPLLREPLREHLAPGCTDLTLDIQQVFYLDSEGIGEMLQAARILAREGRQLRIRVNRRQQLIFRLIGVGHLVHLEMD